MIKPFVSQATLSKLTEAEELAVMLAVALGFLRDGLKQGGLATEEALQVGTTTVRLLESIDSLMNHFDLTPTDTADLAKYVRGMDAIKKAIASPTPTSLPRARPE